ncbi:MAG: sigma-54-dependent Fis family transcriptional regulator [Desulfuromusa sp.]|nr:sigma-54-dependent Fis family transcriptional regulator [Desulfuromusa sp.]
MIASDNDFFRQATMCICGSLDFGQGMQLLLHYLKPFLPGDTMLLSLYEPKFAGIKFKIEVNTSEVKSHETIVPLSPESQDLLKDQTWPDSRIVNCPESDPVINEILSHQILSHKNLSVFRNTNFSMLLMRLTLDGVRIGTVILRTEGRNIYSEEHLRLFSMLNDPFATAFSNSIKYQEIIRLKNLLADDNRYLQRELQNLSGDEIIGKDFGLKDIMEMVREISQIDSTVLILGDTGTGKEVMANAIHKLSPRRNGPFIKINCGAIPPTLIDSELFGHEKGAFTGAITRTRGCFERADKGTIFLDEVAELPLAAQVRMLRVLQDREIVRVGSTEPTQVNIRIIAATHQDLQGLVKEKKFREDLWFRINVFPIKMPSLRERKEDIPAFVKHFIEKKSKEMRLSPPPPLDKGAMERLMAYSWPGNVRELENIVERALILSRGKPLTFLDIVCCDDRKQPLSQPSSDEDELIDLDSLIANHIRQALKVSNGKINGPGGVAELLDINPGTLRHRMKKLGISYSRLHN